MKLYKLRQHPILAINCSMGFKIRYSLATLLFFILLVSCEKNDIEDPEITIDAGNDIENISDFWTTLNADSLLKGEDGVWSIEKGLIDEKVYFEDIKKPKTKFYGLPGEKYLLLWKVLSNGKYYCDSIHVSFNPIDAEIIKSGNDFYSTRILLTANSSYEGTWTISGDIQNYRSLQLGGVIVPKENYPSIEIYGKEKGTIYAKWTVTYGSVSFYDTIIFKTGNYNEYEALEDIGILDYPGQHYIVENNHVTEIHLGGDPRGWIFERFEEFPALSSLKYLTKLILSGDGLHSFSYSIPMYYRNLTYLDLSSNYINQIPSNIGNLKNLSTLLLDNPQDHNEISQIPEDFCKLENLKYLDLSSNNICLLPTNFGNLKMLETLILWGNTLHEIPSSFGNLSSLKYFYVLGIENNLPESFSQLTNLIEFNINGGSTFSKLPDNIGNLRRLKQLVITGKNTFETLPGSFCNLDSLKQLVISSNLKELPVNFGNLKSLKIINLLANLTYLPPSFSELNGLENLTISSSPGSEISLMLPQNIGNLTNLKTIQIQFIDLISLPISIGSLSELVHLNLSNCSLKSIPSSIGDLNNLGYLYLSENELSIIPESFKNLHLEVLNLGGNPNLAWQIEEIRNWNICSTFYYW